MSIRNAFSLLMVCYVLFGGFCGLCGASTISGCASAPHVLHNEDATLGANLNVPTAYACIDFSGSQNAVFNGNNLAITAAPGDYNKGVAILINNATNLSITNVNFPSARLYVTNSVNITITLCNFSGGGTGTEPGIWSSAVDGLVVTKNSFTTNATFYSNSSSRISVRDNTFTNIKIPGNVMDLNSPYRFSVANNTFENSVASTAICVLTTTSFTDSGGDVSGNFVLGGTYTNPIYIYMYGLVGYTVENNLVSRINGACGGAFIPFMVVGNDITTSVTFSNNKLEHCYAGCVQDYGFAFEFYTTTATVSNNIVNNMTYYLVESADPSDLDVVVFEDSNATITNLTISNVILADQSFSNNSLTGVCQYSTRGLNTISIDGLVVENLIVEKTPDCAPQDTWCDFAPGHDVFGIYSEGNVHAKNIFINGLTAGDGGLISSIDQYSGFYGGFALGVASNPYSDVVVTVSNATFKNFKGGNSGGLNAGVNGSLCQTSGRTIYYANGGTDYLPSNTSIPPSVTQLQISNFLFGISNCDPVGGLDAPTNAAVTTFNRTSFTLSWDPVIGSKREVVSYSVDIALGGNWTNKYSGIDLSHSFSELTPANAYHARLRAVQGAAYSQYVYFVVTTPPTTVPDPPNVPTYKEFSTNSITLNWTPSNEDGGLPVTNFTLQMLNNSVWSSIYSGNLTTYKAVGLNGSTTYRFRTAASNGVGQSAFSADNPITTAARMCGDGTCDVGTETCNSCYLDCGSCGYPTCPPCNGGTCVNGTCACPAGFSGPDCKFTSVPIAVQINPTSPYSTISLLNNSTTPKFTIGFRDIQEIDGFGKVVAFADLSQLQYVSFPGNSSIVWNETIYTTTLPNRAIITVNLYVVLQDSTFLFAGQILNASANSVKYSMTISNWPFKTYNNRLKVALVSVETTQNQPKDECVDSQTDNNENNLLWMQVKLNGAVLYGTFSPYAEIDGAASRVQYYYNSSNSLVEITIPFFWDQAEFDPNFQVLLDDYSDSTCTSARRNPNKLGQLSSGKIAAIVVGTVVGLAIIVALVLCFVLRNRKTWRSRPPPKSESSVHLEPASRQPRKIVSAYQNS